MSTNRWNSWHLHLDTGADTALDRVVSKVAAPMAQSRPWFFIRYWQGGPHVRLRVADLTAHDVSELTAGLEALMLVHAPPQEGEPALDPDVYTEEATRHARGETGENRTVSTLRPAGVYRAEYTPEVDRYGGSRVMSLSEDLFVESSALVLQQLPVASTHTARRILALRLAEAAAQALGPREARAVFYEIGRRAWVALAGSYGFNAASVAQAARSGSNLSPDSFAMNDCLRTWRTEVSAFVEQLKREEVPLPGAVVSSHIHMTHNRLGLSILDELGTYAVLARVFPAPEGSIPDFALPVAG